MHPSWYVTQPILLLAYLLTAITAILAIPWALLVLSAAKFLDRAERWDARSS